MITRNKYPMGRIWRRLTNPDVIMQECSTQHYYQASLLKCQNSFFFSAKFPLAIYFTYGNVSFHATLSIHLTLSSPLTMSISLFSMSVSPLLPCKYILQYHFSRLCIYVLEYDIYLSLSHSFHSV